jgi:hypothetical protein
LSQTEKEKVYDEQIAPLMKEIVQICDKHKISHLFTLSLGTSESGDDVGVTSLNIEDDRDPPIAILALTKMLMHLLDGNITRVEDVSGASHGFNPENN